MLRERMGHREWCSSRKDQAETGSCLVRTHPIYFPLQHVHQRTIQNRLDLSLPPAARNQQYAVCYVDLRCAPCSTSDCSSWHAARATVGIGAHTATPSSAPSAEVLGIHRLRQRSPTRSYHRAASSSTHRAPFRPVTPTDALGPSSTHPSAPHV